MTTTIVTRSVSEFPWFNASIYNGNATSTSMIPMMTPTVTPMTTTPIVGKNMTTSTMTTITAAFFNDQNVQEDIIAKTLWYLYDHFHGEPPNYFLIILYMPVIAVAVIANLLVIAVVFKYHYMRSVTNYFVVNLSVADLLVTTICMPVAVTQGVSLVWIYGEVMCKLFSYLQGVAVAVSVYTITAMSLDRYLAIRSPIAFRRVFNRKSTVVVIVILWLVALSIFVPIFQGVTLRNPIMEHFNITLHPSWAPQPSFLDNDSRASQFPPDFYICSADLNPLGIRADLFGIACFILVYAIPGFVVIMAYAMMGRTLCARKPPFDRDSVKDSASSKQNSRLVRERRRIAWILLFLAVLFAVCWLPYNVLRLLVDLGAVDEGQTVTDALSYCLFMGHANSALNPVVYCFMTRNFRESVAEILRRGTRGLTRRKPRRKGVQRATEDACGGCSTVDPRRASPRRRKMLLACCTPMGGPEMANSTSGYNSFYSRHSHRRHCYMLKSLQEKPQIKIEPKPVDVIEDGPRQCTVVTIDDRRGT